MRLPLEIATLPRLENFDLRWANAPTLPTWIANLKARGRVVCRRSASIEPRQELAQKQQAEIIEAIKNLHHHWVNLVRKVEAFRDQKLFLHIVNPTTGKCFKRLDEWGRHTLGISASRMFADLKVVHELTGIVEDQKLAKMTKQNAYELIHLKRAHQPIHPWVIEDAITLTYEQLRARHSILPAPPGARQKDLTRQLGPYEVSEETFRLFKKALDAAKRSAKRLGEPALNDSGLRLKASGGTIQDCTTNKA